MSDNATQNPEVQEQPKADVVPKEEFNKVQSSYQELQSKFQSISEQYSKMQEQLSAFGDITPDKVKELKALKDNVRAQEAGSNPEAINELVNEKVAEVQKSLGSKVEEKDATIKQLKATLHKYEVVNHVMNDNASRVNDDVRDDVSDAVAKFVKKDNNGNFIVVDSEGNPRYSGVNPSQLMTPKELFEEFEAKKPSWFKPKGVNKGSIQPGQAMSGPTKDSQQFDIQRALHDKAYRQGLPFQARQEVYDALTKKK